MIDNRRYAVLYVYYHHTADADRKLRREVRLTGNRQEVESASMSLVRGKADPTLTDILNTQWPPTHGRPAEWKVKHCVLSSIIEEVGDANAPLSVTTSFFEFRTAPKH